MKLPIQAPPTIRKVSIAKISGMIVAPTLPVIYVAKWVEEQPVIRFLVASAHSKTPLDM